VATATANVIKATTCASVNSQTGACQERDRFQPGETSYAWIQLGRLTVGANHQMEWFWKTPSGQIYSKVRHAFAATSNTQMEWSYLPLPADATGTWRIEARLDGRKLGELRVPVGN